MGNPQEREHDHATVCSACGEQIPLRTMNVGLLELKRVATTYGPNDVCAVCWFVGDDPECDRLHCNDTIGPCECCPTNPDTRG